MSKKWKFGILLFIIIVSIATTPLFRRAKTKYFSPYGTCQKAAMSLNATFKYDHMFSEEFFTTSIIFDGGRFAYICETIGVGPFWINDITYPLID